MRLATILFIFVVEIPGLFYSDVRNHKLLFTVTNMAINKVEAARLARKCLPKMRKDNELIPKGIEDNLAAEDVSVECLCRLWAG